MSRQSGNIPAPDRECVAGDSGERGSALLSSYIDGELPENDRAALEAHLAQCAACARVSDELRAVRDWLGSDQPGIEDAASVEQWPSVRARLAQRTVNNGMVARLARSRGLVAAGFLLAVVAGALMLVRPALRHSDPGALDAATAHSAPSAEVDNSESEYNAAVKDLERVLDSERGAQAVRPAGAVAENLSILDTAIRQARSALKADPGDEFVAGYLRVLERRKIDALRDAVEYIRARA